MKVEHAPVVEDRRLRAALKALRERVGLELTALARGLHTVRSRQLFRRWGYDSFPAYTHAELDLEAMTAYKLARIYECFREDWARAEAIGWHRLDAIAPLVSAGRLPAAAAVDLALRPRATIRSLRALVLETFAPPLEADGPDPLPGESHAHVDWGPKQAGRRPVLVDPLRVLSGLKIVRRVEGALGKPEQVVVALSLTRGAYNRLLEALAALPEADLECRLLTLCAGDAPRE